MKPSISGLVLSALLLLVSCSGAEDGSTESARAETPPADSGEVSDRGVCSESRVVSLLTYNVHGLPEAITKDDTAARMKAISPLLNGYPLAALQENFAHSDLLMGSVKHSHFDHSDHKPEGKAYHSGLTLLSRFPLRPLRKEGWSRCHGVLDHASDCLAAKGYQAVRLRLGRRCAGLEVDLYNLHMEAGGSETDRQVRLAQTEQLLSTIAELSRGRAVLVVGDTNMKPFRKDERDKKAWERLLSGAGLSDACLTLNCADPKRIDRVLYRSGRRVTVAPQDWSIPSEFVDGSGRPLSDHLPVLVELRFSLRETGGGR